ncbi:MAG TPA: cell envelope integrity protein CreD [Flavitalea sp.]|nr:cell envelope integrity protein CreD [Flavitalea sp.]
METIEPIAGMRNKLIIKVGIIGLIILMLQLAVFFVKEIVYEREATQKNAAIEVSSKWAGTQNFAGPMLVLPYRDTGIYKSKHYAYILPDVLQVDASVVPEERSRGIYKVMLYSSHSRITGSFDSIDLSKLNLATDQVIWKEAAVQVGISDIKGLNDEVKMQWRNRTLKFSTGAVTKRGDGILSAEISLNGPEDLANIPFSADIHLNGSGQLLFTPLGKSTTVTLSSKWPHPSFTGDILPQSTTVKDSGFSATWKSMAHKRKFSQQWTDAQYNFNDPDKPGSGYNISNSAFGANLYLPVSGYQKTMRSVKYSMLCILLTFAAFFLIEITRKKSVHPFQYGLIGLALVVFYLLLLSISEYTGFNAAYIIASFLTIALIAWFVKGILGSLGSTGILSLTLLLIYTYVFTILQLQDFSLLLGSLGLFISLAVIMKYSKKIEW